MTNKMQLPEATRRLFLKRSFQALAVTAALPALSTLNVAFAENNDKTKALLALSPDIYKILVSVSDTYIPQGGAFDLGAIDIDLAQRIDFYLAKNDPAVAQGVSGALQFIEYKSAEIMGEKGFFSTLSLTKRTQIIQTLSEASGMGVQIYAALRGLCMFFFYTDEKSWQPIGYQGPLVKNNFKE